MKYDFWGEGYVEATMGDYAHVFIAPHPFVRFENLKPSSIRDSYVHLQRIPEGQEYFDFFENTHFGDYSKANGEAITLQDVARSGGFESAKDVFHGVMSISAFLRDELRNRPLIEKLEAVVRKESLFMPEDDTLPAVFEACVGRAFRNLGVSKFVMQDFFETAKVAIEVDELLNLDKSISNLERPDKDYLFAKDMSVLFVSLTESYETIICCHDDVLERFNPADVFEGFWAVPEVDTGWFCFDDQWQKVCADPRNQKLEFVTSKAGE